MLDARVSEELPKIVVELRVQEKNWKLTSELVKSGWLLHVHDSQFAIVALNLYRPFYVWKTHDASDPLPPMMSSQTAFL